ncbi:GntR family transcriptional regulator [Bordetella pertussis]|nr:GntR family transcriptional regulator [Bordetella pertussis]
MYPLAPLHAPAGAGQARRPAGLILGYASLDVEQIRQGIAILASAIGRAAPARANSRTARRLARPPP